jgi:hypothetical protein
VPEITEFAIGTCAVHGGVFAFDPEQVPAVLIDPETGRPPDVDAAGHHCEASQEARNRSVARPYCPSCAREINAECRRRGMPAIFDETDTAPQGLQGHL